MALREKLTTDIADLTAQAEAADAEDTPDSQALPKEIARRETLKAKLDEACKRFEAEAEADHEEAKRAPSAPQARPKRAYEKKKGAYDATSGRKGSRRSRRRMARRGMGSPLRRSVKTNLIDPDSQSASL